MYLGMDFLIAPGPSPLLIEVNVGLPGGAQEYELAHRLYRGRPSGIFDRIEDLSRERYGLSFKDYLGSLPFLEPLKHMKLWMDGHGTFPGRFHPALRLEDKWVQYGLLSPLVPMPQTVLFDPGDEAAFRAFIEGRGKAVLKRRTARGGRGLRIIDSATDWRTLSAEPLPGLLQDHVDSRVDGFTLSIRSVAFAGEPVALYANLTGRPTSNHGVLAFVVPGPAFGLTRSPFEVRAFVERSWEAALWFGDDPAGDPDYLRHNLNEDRVAEAALILPHDVYRTIGKISVRIERLYEGLDFETLPPAWFESPRP